MVPSACTAANGTRADVIGKVFAGVKEEPGLLVECIIDNSALFFFCFFSEGSKKKVKKKKRFFGA